MSLALRETMLIVNYGYKRHIELKDAHWHFNTLEMKLN